MRGPAGDRGIAINVDRFFDDVLVMAEEESTRRNRLALSAELLREFSTIADFSEMVAGRSVDQHRLARTRRQKKTLKG
ncbi:MAG TPA: hypothetical protein VKE24_05550 [Candidatus Acidoferrales bacterium]|nr:hypothetical protein [Candidatus Acidoferrales bacterium]